MSTPNHILLQPREYPRDLCLETVKGIFRTDREVKMNNPERGDQLFWVCTIYFQMLVARFHFVAFDSDHAYDAYDAYDAYIGSTYSNGFIPWYSYA